MGAAARAVVGGVVPQGEAVKVQADPVPVAMVLHRVPVAGVPLLEAARLPRANRRIGISKRVSLAGGDAPL